MSSEVIAINTGRPDDALGWVRECLTKGAKGFSVVSYNADGTFTTVHLGVVDFFVMCAAGFSMQQQSNQRSIEAGNNEG